MSPLYTQEGLGGTAHRGKQLMESAGSCNTPIHPDYISVCLFKLFIVMYACLPVFRCLLTLMKLTYFNSAHPATLLNRLCIDHLILLSWTPHVWIENKNVTHIYIGDITPPPSLVVQVRFSLAVALNISPSSLSTQFQPEFNFLPNMNISKHEHFSQEIGPTPENINDETLDTIPIENWTFKLMEI